MVGGDVDGSQPAPGEAALVQDVTQSLRARNMACIVVDENMAEAMRCVNAVSIASWPSGPTTLIAHRPCPST